MRVLHDRPLPWSPHLQTAVWLSVFVVLLTVSFVTNPLSVGALQEAGGWSTMVFLGVMAAATEVVQIKLSHTGGHDDGITLLETAIAAALVLLPANWVVVAVISGLTVGQLLLRREMVKLLFNTGQIGTAVLAAAAITSLAGPPDPMAVSTVAAASGGMLVYALINSVAITGVLSHLTGRPPGSVLRAEAPMTVVPTLGNTTVGFVAALLWVSAPLSVGLLGVVAWTLRLAYGGMAVRDELLEKVRHERDRFEQVLANASDGIVLLDEHNQVSMWSPAMADLLGVPENQVVSQQLAAVLEVCGCADVTTEAGPCDGLLEASPERPEVNNLVTLHHVDGGHRIVQVTHRVLFDDDGHRQAAVAVFRDVTKQQEADRLKDDFVSRVSHELRTPLTPIKGFAQTLQRRGLSGLSAQVFDVAVDRIVDRSAHMERLINDLLLVSQVTEGIDASARFKIRSYDVAPLVDAAVQQTLEMHPDRRISQQVAAGLPQVVVDKMRLEQVLANLLSNACKYSPADSRVRVAARRDGGQVVFDVIDNGRGIDPDQQTKIFERFHRVEDPLLMETGGVGVGLFIAKRLVASMDGTIEVTSELGEGSTFTVRLPAQDPADVEGSGGPTAGATVEEADGSAADSGAADSGAGG